MGKQPKAGFRPKSGKQPRATLVPETQKQPRAVAGGSIYSYRPSWRIAAMAMLERFGWHKLDASKLREVRAKLGQFETMTWSEILLDSKKQNHLVEIEKIIPPAQTWLERNKILLDKIVSLRLSGQERVWGYLAEHGVMVVLWWDPEHEVCPSILKNT